MSAACLIFGKLPYTSLQLGYIIFLLFKAKCLAKSFLMEGTVTVIVWQYALLLVVQQNLILFSNNMFKKVLLTIVICSIATLNSHILLLALLLCILYQSAVPLSGVNRVIQNKHMFAPSCVLTVVEMAREYLSRATTLETAWKHKEQVQDIWDCMRELRERR